MTLRDQRFTLAVATLGSFVALLDSTVVGIALPAIGDDLAVASRSSSGSSTRISWRWAR